MVRDVLIREHTKKQSAPHSVFVYQHHSINTLAPKLRIRPKDKLILVRYDAGNCLTIDIFEK